MADESVVQTDSVEDNSNQATERSAINLLLSREEVLVVLERLQVDTLLGLDPDPRGELSAEAQELTNIVAGRALRARGMAAVRDDGELLLHGDLLAAVGICAFAERALFLMHWPTPDASPIRYFAHLRTGESGSEDIAGHGRPEDVLHLFSLIPTKEELAQRVCNLCQMTEEEITSAGTVAFDLTQGQFADVREMAATDAPRAITLLQESGVEDEVASAFVKTFASGPRLSILQTVRPGADGETNAPDKRDFTLIQSVGQRWLMAQESEGQLSISVPTLRTLQEKLLSGVAA